MAVVDIYRAELPACRAGQDEIARFHVLVFTETPSGIRAISFRKANRREVRQYENAK